jgi:hypothetical protein
MMLSTAGLLTRTIHRRTVGVRTNPHDNVLTFYTFHGSSNSGVIVNRPDGARGWARVLEVLGGFCGGGWLYLNCGRGLSGDTGLGGASVCGVLGPVIVIDAALCALFGTRLDRLIGCLCKR